MEETYMSINRGMDKKDVVTYITHTHKSSIRKINVILPFAATWLDLEIIILGKVKKKYHLHVYKTEKDSQTSKTTLLPKGKGRGRNKLGVWY